MTRVLRPHGLLLLRTNSRCGYPPTDASDYHRYRLHEVRALAREAGMTIHTASYVNAVPGFVASVRLRLSRANGSSDPNPLPLRTKSAGSVVDTRVPKNGTIATSQSPNSPTEPWANSSATRVRFVCVGDFET